MPIYEYKALTNAGDTKTDVITADTPREARVKLQGQKLFVTSLKELVGREKQKEGWLKRIRSSTSGPSMSTRRLEEVAGLTRQFSTLLRAGIPLIEALKATVEQAEGNRQLHTMLLDLRERVSQGMNLADALALHPQYFNALYINMVRAGEVAGKLDVVLGQVADFISKSTRLRNKVSAALTYPLMMLAIGGLVVFVLMWKVVPQITTIILGLNQQLPFATRLLIGVSNWFQHWWWLPILSLVVLLFLFNTAYRLPEYRRRIDALLLKLPVLGDLFRKQAVSRFAMTFSALLKTGVPAVRCLEIVKDVVNNRVIGDVIGQVHDRILEGADISTPIKRSGVFPPVVGYMIAIGEQSGQLEEILDRITESYEEEIDLSTQKATSLLEPLLIVGLALVVGFIVISIILPILQISQSL
ncbi:MAG: type II secretion system F family protein [Planctomycetes bacterium]|nr:type II secretion system F family protein [Planctomycetota bacterium]